MWVLPASPIHHVDPLHRLAAAAEHRLGDRPLAARHREDGAVVIAVEMHVQQPRGALVRTVLAGDGLADRGHDPRAGALGDVRH